MSKIFTRSFSLLILDDLAKKRWQNLRSSYTRSKSLKSLKLKSQSQPFYLAPQLSFLDCHLPVKGEVISDSANTSELELQEEGEEGDGSSDCSIPLRSAPSPSPSPPPQAPPHLNNWRILLNKSLESHSETQSHSPRLTSVKEEDPPQRRKRAHDSNNDEPWQVAAKAFFLSQPQTGTSASTVASTSTSEGRNPDFEYLKGLLPQIEQLEKKNKRLYFQKISNLLFEMLDQQDEAAEEREARAFMS